MMMKKKGLLLCQSSTNIKEKNPLLAARGQVDRPDDDDDDDDDDGYQKKKKGGQGERRKEIDVVDTVRARVTNGNVVRTICFCCAHVE